MTEFILTCYGRPSYAVSVMEFLDGKAARFVVSLDSFGSAWGQECLNRGWSVAKVRRTKRTGPHDVADRSRGVAEAETLERR